MVKNRCVICTIETGQTYFKKDGTGPVCYPCMRASGEHPAITVLGDSTHICSYDYYMMERHDGKGFYKDDFGRMVPCGMFPDYSSRDAPPRKSLSDRIRSTDIKDMLADQLEYEAKNWTSTNEVEDVRHIILHLNKLLGDLSNVVEAYEHEVRNNPDVAKGPYQKFPEQLKRKAIADLQIYSLHLAGRWGYRPAELFYGRIQENKKKAESARQAREKKEEGQIDK